MFMRLLTVTKRPFPFESHKVLTNALNIRWPLSRHFQTRLAGRRIGTFPSWRGTAIVCSINLLTLNR